MFERENQEVYVPDGSDLLEALGRTTHLCVAAHQDDIEIMAVDGILRAFDDPEVHFSGCIVSDGRGFPKKGHYEQFSPDELVAIRNQEQKKAARIGRYSAQVFLGYPSKEVKQPGNQALIDDLRELLRLTQPDVIYTHNPADKHPTHIGVLLRLLEALRGMPRELQPKQLLGCEAWRDLDWLPDNKKVLFDLSSHKQLQKKLVEVFESQIEGGKDYTGASLGRRAANATFFQSHATDTVTGMGFGMDLTPLLDDPQLDPAAFVKSLLLEFQQEVLGLIEITK
jgi:LmbE family N-acetylglucosaminyl deacetylase